MDKIIKNILKKIELNGFEAYLVGGFVRDSLLGISTNDIDICTNALPKDLIKIFKNVTPTNYGNINIKIKKYNFDITTYRSDEIYENSKLISNNYVNNLIKDLERRDFTINAILMNSKGEIIDLIAGVEDLNSKKVKVIGNTFKKLESDALRILRAIRISTTLDFALDDKLISGINKYKNNLKLLSKEKIRNEIDIILLSSNVYKGIKLLKEFGIDKIIGIEFNNLVSINDLNGLWAQITLKENYPFTKVEKDHIKNIKKIIDYGRIDSTILYEYGLFYATIAGSILGISKKEVYNINKKMTIHNNEDIAIKPKEILNIIKEEPSSKISTIINDLKDNILNNKLRNNKKELKSYVERKWSNGKR